MKIKTIIAAIVALTAAPPLALASSHDREFYVGGDIGQVSLNDHEDDCDTQVNKYAADAAIAITSTVAVKAIPNANTPNVTVTTNILQTITFPKAGEEGASTKGSCEDAAFAPRMVVGYKVNDMFSVEGFFGWASGFDAAVNVTPQLAIANTVSKDILDFEDKTEIDYAYFGLVLNGQYEVSRDIMVGGKIGIQQTSADVTRTITWSDNLPSDAHQIFHDLLDSMRAPLQNFQSDVSGVTKENKTEAIYGISAAYQITDALSVRAGYDLSGISNYMHGGVTYNLSF